MPSTTLTDHERARDLVENDICSLCGSGFVVVDEEETYEPRSTVYACVNHREHGSGQCPGSIITLYQDGHVSRRVFGRGNVPVDTQANRSE